MSDLIERFRTLYQSFRHSNHASNIGFDTAQVELFNLAQALGHLYCPKIQTELNAVRRQVMKQLTGDLHKLRFSDAVMVLGKRRMTWVDFQITPEVTADFRLIGRVVDSQLVKKLNSLRRQQVSQILKVTGV